MSSITIYHNPQCGTSRNVLALIRNTGAEPIIIEYLVTPPTREKLTELLTQMAIPARDLLRQKGALYDELQLNDLALSESALIDAMLAHPILMNRPIVQTALGTRLCRPSEAVIDILPLPQQAKFTKEDGEPVINEQGERIAGR